MKQQRVPSLVTITILTTITLIFWILFSVYRVLTAKPAPDIPSQILEPITPTLDAAVISKIENSVFFQESQITTPVVSVSPLPSPAPRLTPTPPTSPSATPKASASPSATPRGG